MIGGDRWSIVLNLKYGDLAQLIMMEQLKESELEKDQGIYILNR